MVVSRAQDIVDILLETDGTPAKGWQTAPNIPFIAVESQAVNINGYRINPPPDTDGAVIVEKEYDFDRESYNPTRENLMWTFTIHIFADTDGELETMILQAREVFDRYNNTPFASDGNSNTYTDLLLDNGSTTSNINSWEFVAELFAHQKNKAIVIA